MEQDNTVTEETSQISLGIFEKMKKNREKNKKRTLIIALTVVFVLIFSFGAYRLYTNQSSIQQATNQTKDSMLDTLENLKQAKLDTAAKLQVIAESYRRAIDSINAIAKSQQEYIRADQLVESNINAANAAIEEYEKLQASPNIITLSVSLQDNQKQAVVTGGGALVILKRE